MNFENEFEAPVENLKSISVSDADETIRRYIETRDAIKKLEDDLKLLNNRRRAMENQITDFLMTNEKDNWSVDGYKLSKVSKFQFRYPDTPEDIRKFHEWADSNGYADARKINHMTLNALAKDIYSQASEQGEIPNIPGLPEPKTEIGLSMRKGK